MKVTVSRDCSIAYRGHTIYHLAQGDNEVPADVGKELQQQVNAAGLGPKRKRRPQTKAITDYENK